MTSEPSRSEYEQLEDIGAAHDVIDIDIDTPCDSAVTIRIHRPEARNAMNGAVRDALQEAINVVDEGDDIRVGVLTGSDAGKAFVAGADVREFRERGMLDQRPHSRPPRLYEHVARCSTPLVARINGHALGGGLELALACDLRIAHERAKLGSPEINLGIIPGGGATQRLPRLIGEGQAMRLILTGELISASEADEIGLVEFVTSDEEFEDIVADVVENIATKSPIALAQAKKAVNAASRMGLSDGIEYEATLFTQLFATADKNEGIDAFLEDREPEWKGR